MYGYFASRGLSLSYGSVTLMIITKDPIMVLLNKRMRVVRSVLKKISP